MRDLVVQVLLSLGYYLGLLLLLRLSGKRLAGQTTTVDLVVLISLGVVMQQMALPPGGRNALVFIGTVFAAHRGLAYSCARSGRLRRFVRGSATPLVRDGRVSLQALADEGLSYDDLLAGLRKLGFDNPSRVRLATLEETGHISAVASDAPDQPQGSR